MLLLRKGTGLSKVENYNFYFAYGEPKWKSRFRLPPNWSMSPQDGKTCPQSLQMAVHVFTQSTKWKEVGAHKWLTQISQWGMMRPRTQAEKLKALLSLTAEMQPNIRVTREVCSWCSSWKQVKKFGASNCLELTWPLAPSASRKCSCSDWLQDPSESQHHFFQLSSNFIWYVEVGTEPEQGLHRKY